MFAVIFLFLSVVIPYSIYLLAYVSIEEEYPKNFIKINLHYQLKLKNALYKCGVCDKYFREYQSELYEAAKDIKKENVKTCPHCEKESRINGLWSSYPEYNHMVKYPEYLDTHLSCPKLKGFEELFAMKKSIKLYKEKNKIDKYQKDFEQFQKKTQDDPLKWLKNIQGDDKF